MEETAEIAVEIVIIALKLTVAPLKSNRKVVDPKLDRMADQKIVYPGAIPKLLPNLIRESVILRSTLVRLAFITRSNALTVKRTGMENKSDWR